MFANRLSVSWNRRSVSRSSSVIGVFEVLSIMFESAWPPKALPASDEYLIAIGTFSLFFSEAEMALWVFFNAYIENEQARNYLFANLHNRARVDLAKTFLDQSDDTTFKTHALAGLAAFDRICENRNIILHAFPLRYQDTQSRLLKRRPNVPGQLAIYHAPLEDVRTNALASNHFHWFAFGLKSYLDACRAGEMQPELPPLPPIPRKLNLYRPPEAQEGD